MKSILKKKKKIRRKKNKSKREKQNQNKNLTTHNNCIPFVSIDVVVDCLLVVLQSDGEMLLRIEIIALSFDGDFDLVFDAECFDDFLQ